MVSSINSHMRLRSSYPSLDPTCPLCDRESTSTDPTVLDLRMKVAVSYMVTGLGWSNDAWPIKVVLAVLMGLDGESVKLQQPPLVHRRESSREKPSLDRAGPGEDV